jgi:hypothetical protein
VTATTAPELADPLSAFVRDARVRAALVLDPSGRVLAQHGFVRSLDVMAACSLAAAIHASASELGRQLEGTAFGPLHTRGATRQTFLAPVDRGGATVLVLAVFDEATSLGIVRHFFTALAGRVAALAGAPAPRALLAEDFERDLGRNLAVLFGRA